MVSIFYFSHSSGCIVVSRDFNLHFSNVKWSWGSYWKWMNPTLKMANNLSINLTRFLFWNYPFNLYYFSIYNHRPKSQNTKVTFLSSRWLSDFYKSSQAFYYLLQIYLFHQHNNAYHLSNTYHPQTLVRELTCMTVPMPPYHFARLIYLSSIKKITEEHVFCPKSHSY